MSLDLSFPIWKLRIVASLPVCVKVTTGNSNRTEQNILAQCLAPSRCLTNNSYYFCRYIILITYIFSFENILRSNPEQNALENGIGNQK